MVRARYCYIVLADSPRDGGWVRLFNSFPSRKDALKAVEFCSPLMQLSRDYVAIQIVKSIVFKAMARGSLSPRLIRILEEDATPQWTGQISR